ncbi:MAG: O-antigen ligase family protein [Myxococcota bacterium]
MSNAFMITTAAAVVAMLLTLILPIYPEGITPLIAAFLALAGVAGLFGLLNRAARRELMVMAPWALALGCALLIGSLRSGESRQALEDSLPYLLFVVGLIAGRGARNPRLVLLTTLAVCIGDSLVSLYKMPSYEVGMRSTYNYFKITAGLPLVGLFLAPLLRHTDPKGRNPMLLSRPIEAAIVVVLFIGMVMSVSRGMLLGWLCGMLVAAYIRKPSQVVLGGLVLAVVFVAYSSTFADFGSRYLRFEAASTVQGRFREIETAWQTFVDYPMFGAGLGAMFEVDGFYKAFVHNMAAYHLWKFGLIGTTLLTVPLLLVGRQLRRAPPVVRSYAVGGAIAVVAYLVTCAAYKTYYLVWIYGVVAGAGLSWLSAWKLRQDQAAALDDPYDSFDDEPEEDDSFEDELR